MKAVLALSKVLDHHCNGPARTHERFGVRASTMRTCREINADRAQAKISVRAIQISNEQGSS